jgi:hypothetical protein
MARSKVPPWIKTFTKLLSDDDYLALSHHLRGVLLGIWLEYARARRQLRGSTVTLTRRLGQRVTTRDLEALNDAGFIAFSASKPARTDAGDVAGLEGEGEGDKRRDNPKPAATLSVVQPESHTHTNNPEKPKELAAAPTIEAPRTSDLRTVCERLRADERQVEPLARNLTTDQFTEIVDTVDSRCRTGSVKNPAGLLIQLLREAQRAAAKTARPQITIDDEIAADYRTAPADTPIEVLHELTQRKLKRRGIPDTDWARLLEIGAHEYARNHSKEAA